MKCPVCGYEYDNDCNVNKTRDEPFIRIDCFGKEFETDVWEYDNYIKVYLYGCPKCKSVQYK